MRGAGGRAQYVSCSASARVVRDGGPSAVEDAPRHRRVTARRSARDVRRVGPCQWDVRAPTLRSPASAGARGKCSHVFTSIAEGDSNLSSLLRSALATLLLALPSRPRVSVRDVSRLAIVSLKSSQYFVSTGRASLLHAERVFMSPKGTLGRVRPIRSPLLAAVSVSRAFARVRSVSVSRTLRSSRDRPPLRIDRVNDRSRTLSSVTQSLVTLGR